jgi:hypothetical protein
VRQRLKRLAVTFHQCVGQPTNTGRCQVEVVATPSEAEAQPSLEMDRAEPIVGEWTMDHSIESAVSLSKRKTQGEDSTK